MVGNTFIETSSSTHRLHNFTVQAHALDNYFHKILTFRVTVNTSTVKTIVPKVQFPKTWKTHGVTIGISVHPLGEAQKRQWGQGCKQGPEGKDVMEWLLQGIDARSGARRPARLAARYATLCHAVPHGRVTQSWDGDRDNLLLTAMSIEDTSHCVSWFLGNLLSSAFSQHLCSSSRFSPICRRQQWVFFHLVWFADTSDYAWQRKAETVYKSKWWQWMGGMLTKGCQDLNAYIKTESEM